MRKYTFTVVLVCLAFVSFSQQTVSRSSFILNATDFLNSTAYKHRDSMKQFILPYRHADESGDFERTIDFGHWQYFYYVRSNDSSYTVFIQGMSDRIYAVIIKKVTYDWYNRTEIEIIRRTDNYLLQLYLDFHNCKYGSAFTATNFKPGSFERFSMGCGGAGTPSTHFLAALDLVKSNDQRGLMLLVGSISPEERTVGAMGLILLQKRNIELNHFQLELIAAFRKSSIPIQFCSGCTDRDSRPMYTLLTDEIIADVYDYFLYYLKFAEKKTEVRFQPLKNAPIAIGATDAQ